MKNTFTNGAVRAIIFEEESVWYGVALEFNIVIDAPTKEKAFVVLENAMREYIKTAHTVNDESVLNQKADPEYESIWNFVQRNEENKIPSPIKLGYCGMMFPSYA